MKCVILAAGMSTRLQPLTRHTPKCLLKVGNKAILDRTLESVLAWRVEDIAIVVGFEAEQIRSHLRQTYTNRRFRIILNPNFRTTNNAYSLLLARKFAVEEDAGPPRSDPLLILDSDIIFHPGVLDALRIAEDGNRLAVRVEGTHDVEEIGVVTDARNQITGIGKYLDSARLFGESIGIELFSHESAKCLFNILEERVKQGIGRTEFYEAAFQEMIQRGQKLDAVDVSRFPSIEIDTRDDLERAEQSVLPQIEQLRDVRLS